MVLGIDWGEAHHDLCLLNQDGRVLAARRIADGLAGVGELHALVAAYAQDPTQVAVGIETDRGLLVAALLAAGYQVYAVNPQVVSYYRGRHGVSRAKGDDPARYQTAKGRKAFAGAAPVTRSSGLRRVVVARAACNQRLVDACYLWAFAALTASRGRGAAMTPTAPVAPPTTRRYGRSGTGWLGSCTAAWPAGSPTRSSWPGQPRSRPPD